MVLDLTGVGTRQRRMRYVDVRFQYHADPFPENPETRKRASFQGLGGQRGLLHAVRHEGVNFKKDEKL